MQSSQQRPQSLGVGKQRHESSRGFSRKFHFRIFQHLMPNLDPTIVLQILAVKTCQLHQPQNLFQIFFDLIDCGWSDADISRSNSEMLIDLTRHQRLQHRSGRSFFSPHAFIDKVIANVANSAGIPKILTHKLLNREERIVARKPKSLRKSHLLVATHPIIGAVGMKVHFVPHSQEKFPRAFQLF